MTLQHVVDNEPVNFRRLPSVRGTVLAKRLLRPPLPRQPTNALGIGWALLILSILFVYEDHYNLSNWGIFAQMGVICGSAIPLLLVYRWHRKRRANVRWPSLASEFQSWEGVVEAVRNSPHAVRINNEVIREREHLFLGMIERSGQPLLLNEVYLQRPAVVVGRTGSGKTKLIAEPLLVQAIRRRKSHIVCIDLKGDKAFMLGLAIEAARSKANFKWLTVEPGKSSYLWNPFTDPGARLLTREQFGQIILRALSLVTGQEHGAGYFGAMQEERTRRTFEQHTLHSFRQFYRIVRNQRAGDIGMSERDFSNAGHLIANLARIASVGVLNATAEDNIPAPALRASISLLDVLSQPGVTYINLPSQVEPTTSLFVAKLWVHLLAAVAKVHEVQRVPVLVWNDEFQEMVAPDLATPIRQARESDVTFWMGFQDLAALETVHGDFTSAVLGNTPLKIFCSAEDEGGRSYIKQTSGETLRSLEGVTITSTQTAEGWSQGTGRQYREEAVPRIDDEAINRVNRDPKAFIAFATESKGFTQFRFPVIARTTFHISPEEFERRRAMPWPRGNHFTVVVEANRNELESETEASPPSATATLPGPTAQSPAQPKRRRGRPPKQAKATEATSPVKPSMDPPVETPTAPSTEPETPPETPPTPSPKPRPPAMGDMAEYLRRLAESAGDDGSAATESN